jgi:pimeloyl-ACP methyl ester carboxylesterase
MKTKTLIAAIAAVIALSACGTSTTSATRATSRDATSTTTSSTTTSARSSAVVDELVPVHGARLHVHCDGAGPNTVILIAGFEGDRSSWVKIEPTVAETTRVCSYERFGDGTSDAPPAAQTFATEAADLHTLLQSIGESGPYVIVGHSFGGPEAVTFASMFPTEVRGLLLVDASPATWNNAVCAVPDDGSDASHSFQTVCGTLSSPANNAEQLDAAAAFAEVAAINSLPAVPMIVATADHHSYPGLAASEEARLDDVWNAGQAHWVSLGSSAQLITVDHTSHNIQLDRPDVVLDKIHELLP